MGNSSIRVLVVDDSAFLRQMISSILSEQPDIEVVGTAPDPIIAREKIKLHNPDVVTLDIEMPRMDGLEFLRRLMTLRPTRVLMLSSLTGRNTEATLRALQIGAIDCLEKPVDSADCTLAMFRAELVEKVRLVASAQIGAITTRTPTVAPRQLAATRSEHALIAIGASTGGVEALSFLLAELPAGLPPVVVVQHMPPRFTGSFAGRLNTACALEVVEGEDGLELRPGRAVIAPGGYQLEVVKRGARLTCRIYEGPLVSGHAPSVDVMFHSAAEAFKSAAIGVILTGMGNDGAQGLLAMRNAGARTFGQDQRSCLVYGMPRAAAELGAVEAQLPLARIPDAIVDAVEAAAGTGRRVAGA